MFPVKTTLDISKHCRAKPINSRCDKEYFWAKRLMYCEMQWIDILILSKPYFSPWQIPNLPFRFVYSLSVCPCAVLSKPVCLLISPFLTNQSLIISVFSQYYSPNRFIHSSSPFLSPFITPSYVSILSACLPVSLSVHSLPAIQFYKLASSLFQGKLSNHRL